MDKRPRQPLDEEAIREHFAKASAPVSMGYRVAGEDRLKPITPDGLRLGSKRVKLLAGKVRGESKASRRLRRRAVVG